MERIVHVGVSNHHVHLTEETYKKLFGDEPLTKEYDLNQVGEFASHQVVTLRTKSSSISNVRVVGPLRKYNQVEIARSDAYKLGLNPPVRRSGNLENSESVTLEGKNGAVLLENVCIVANRHVHLSSEDAISMGLSDNELVRIVVKGDKSCILDAYTKVSDNGFFELHLDFDDANAAGLKSGDEVLMVYGEESCGK